MVKSLNRKPLEKQGEWYRLVEMFDPSEGVLAAPEGLGPVVLKGKISELPVFVLPPSCTLGQAERLVEFVKQETGMMPLVVTNNVDFAKLQKLSPKQAAGLIERAAEIRKAREGAAT